METEVGAIEVAVLNGGAQIGDRSLADTNDTATGGSRHHIPLYSRKRELIYQGRIMQTNARIALMTSFHEKTGAVFQEMRVSLLTWPRQLMMHRTDVARKAGPPPKTFHRLDSLILWRA